MERRLSERIARVTARRTRVLIELDIDGARELNIGHHRYKGLPPVSDEVLLAAMHRARYEAQKHIPEALRHESGEWLRARGLSRIRRFGRDRPLLPPGELPTDRVVVKPTRKPPSKKRQRQEAALRNALG